jgi:hypothetical protein
VDSSDALIKLAVRFCNLIFVDKKDEGKCWGITIDKIKNS